MLVLLGHTEEIALTCSALKFGDIARVREPNNSCHLMFIGERDYMVSLSNGKIIDKNSETAKTYSIIHVYKKGDILNIEVI